MPLKWDDELTTNIDKIDSQHKELFRRINILMEACNLGKGRNEIESLFLFLENYIKEHFALEESLMHQYKYNEFLTHKSQHNDFNKQFLMMKSDLDLGGITLPIVLSTNYLLGDWWRYHIKTTDKLLGKFLKTQSIEEIIRSDD